MLCRNDCPRFAPGDFAGRPRRRHAAPAAGAGRRRHPHRPAGGVDGTRRHHRVVGREPAARAASASRGTPCRPCRPRAARRCCAGLPAAKGAAHDEQDRRSDGRSVSKTFPFQVLPAIAVGRATPDLPRRAPGDHRRRAAPLAGTAERQLVRRSRPAMPSVGTGRSAPSSAGVELVAWRDEDGALHVGPGACPHLGADLCDRHRRLRRADLPVARAAAGRRREFGWRPYPPRRRRAGLGAPGPRRR